MKGQKNLLITKLEDIQDFKRKSSGFTREKSDNCQFEEEQRKEKIKLQMQKHYREERRDLVIDLNKKVL